ncbi:hypothetical protein ES703_23488 [subsurface metagenome]
MVVIPLISKSCKTEELTLVTVPAIVVVLEVLLRLAVRIIWASLASSAAILSLI